jgi:hypothetical protein
MSTNFGKFIRPYGQYGHEEFVPEGGMIFQFKAAASNMKIGDAVFISGVGTVAKSTTKADYAKFVGFIVGVPWMPENLKVGTEVTKANKPVYVQVSGIARAIVGATGFTAGTTVYVTPSAATAGAVIPIASGQYVIGIPLTTQATAGGEVRVLIRPGSFEGT